MTIPKMPTDNLYKFLAIFGLVLLIYGSYQANHSYQTIFRDIDRFGTKADLYYLEKERANNSSNDSTSLLRKEIQLKMDSIILEGVQKQIKRQTTFFPKFFAGFLILAIVGAFISIIGFSGWYFNTQVPQDKILNNEALKHSLEKSILVHSTQFKKEFSIYEQLWKKLIELRNSTMSLRPMLDYIDKNKSEEEIKNERLTVFKPAFDDCVKIFDNNRPFYPEKVYKEVEEVIRLSRSEALKYQHDNPSRNDEYWKSAQKNLDKLLAAIDKVCKEMRKRMEIIKSNG